MINSLSDLFHFYFTNLKHCRKHSIKQRHAGYPETSSSLLNGTVPCRFNFSIRTQGGAYTSFSTARISFYDSVQRQPSVKTSKLKYSDWILHTGPTIHQYIDQTGALKGPGGCLLDLTKDPESYINCLLSHRQAAKYPTHQRAIVTEQPSSCTQHTAPAV